MVAAEGGEGWRVGKGDFVCWSPVGVWRVSAEVLVFVNRANGRGVGAVQPADGRGGL